MDALFETPETARLFAADGWVRRMLAFEAALAEAAAELGLVTPQAAAAVVGCCGIADYDAVGLMAAARTAGNPAIPLVQALTRAVAARDPAATAAVHVGATSQDVIDTAMMLQLKAGLALILDDVDRIAAALALLARDHRDTVMIGRTLLQQALPVTFGLKAAGWLSAVARVRARLDALGRDGLALQFGGAAGTLLGLDGRGLELARALGRRLDLPVPDLPWHTARDRVAEIGAALALLTGTLGKIGRDLTLLMQSEVAEVLEPAESGRGGSSAMPHKRNPVAPVIAVAAAELAPPLAGALLAGMVQEHERAAGAWHAEWLALPRLVALAHAASAALAPCLAGLEVEAGRMAANLAASHGLFAAEALAAALTPALGRGVAQDRAKALARRAHAEARPLKELAAADADIAAALDPAALDALFDPARRTGLAGLLIDRALAAAGFPELE